MRLFIDFVNTQDLPHTIAILNNFLPSIFTSECFNERKLPFSEEAAQTEVGHLFEHILLEYLCDLSDFNGEEVMYNGITRWDWRKNEHGTFAITIDVPYDEINVLTRALGKSVKLLTLILSQPKTTFEYFLSPVNSLSISSQMA